MNNLHKKQNAFVNDLFRQLNNLLLNLNFKYFFGAALVLALTASIGFFNLYLSEETRFGGAGEEVEAKVAAKGKGRAKLAESAAEIEVAASESGPIIYRNNDSFSNKIWFMVNFDRSGVYDSQPQIRSDVPSPIF